jgi:glycosyltransferase involved in cell wall biosynthesis
MVKDAARVRTLVFNALRMSGKRTAVGHHVEYLTRQWSRTAVPFDRIVLMSNGPLHVEGLGTTTPVEFRSFGGRWPNLVWEQVLLPRAARGAAVLFTEYNAPLRYRGRIVVANHGIYQANLAKTFSWVQRLRSTPLNKASVHRAERVIANSLSTQSDLMEFWKVPGEKIDLVYPAAADLFFEPKDPAAVGAEITAVFGSRVPYLIFVGKLSRRRNVPNLIEAFAVAKRTLNLPHQLLIVGPNTSDLPLADLIARSGAGDAIHYLPYLEQKKLALLYAGAELFVLPSTYEGISWTMFEAMASGVAVLAVEHKALAEGGAEAVLAMPTASVEDLVRGMQQLLCNPAERERYRQLGLDRVQRFSMRECAAATMDVIDKAAAPRDEGLAAGEPA